MNPSARLSPRVAVLLAALVGAALRVPFIGTTLSSDEAGFLMVGGQWSPGSSLYGDYWVDRPPLLIGIFQLANALGGSLALRLFGIVALVVATWLGALIGRLASGWRWAPVVVGTVPAVLMADVLYGAPEVDGELLAVPFVLAGLYAVLRAVLAPDRRTLPTRLWWVAAGALAVLAGSIKQSMLDVFVAGGVAVLWLAVRRLWRPALEAAAGLVVGAVVAGGAIVGWAAANGTRPGALFDAVITFRGRAAAVIAEDSSGATSDRAHHVAEAFLGSCAWGIGLVAAISLAVWLLRRRRGSSGPAPSPLGWIAAGTAVWETVGVVAGGSYWLHYLIGTVAGSTLLAAAVLQARQLRARWLVAAVAVIVAVAVPATVVAYATPPAQTEAQVSAYLRAHSHPGDSAVVCFGHANIVRGAGLADPYVNLWSLPVRVRDPHLVRFTRVLLRRRPTWVIVDGPRIDTWAIDSRRANAVLAKDYHAVTTIGSWYLLRSRSAG